MKTALLLPLLAFGLPATAQAPSAETRAAAEANAVALFARLDLDGNGFVTRDEMARFAAARTGETVVPGAPLSPGAAAMFDDADTNRDGTISRAEAVAGSLRGFDEADTNHDGKVTAAEREAVTRRVTNAIAPSPDASPAPRERSGPPAPQS